MPEDWNAVAAEVEDAIRSVGDVTQLDGYPATIRKAGTDAPANPWDQPGGTPTYHTVRVVVDDKELRDINGTLIGQTMRTVTVSGAAGVVPHDNDRIALSITATEADENSSWQEILSVKPLAPAGVVVLYELVLQG